MDIIGCICNSPNLDYIKNLKLEMKDKCKVYCEIGVLYGGSMIMMMDMNYTCLHIGIDPFTGYYGKSYDPHRSVDLTNHYEIVEENLYNNNPNFQDWKLIKGNSEDVADKVKETIDYLFIDGDHKYDAVIRDFKNYKDKVRKGGIIVFDNYNDPSWKEVAPAVELIILEYKDEFKLKEKKYHCCVLEKII